MASVKTLKKDIDLIEEAVSMRNDFIDRVNNPDGKDNPALVKAYYSALRKDLLEKVDGYFEKLSSLAKSE
jgi:hypothetical protein